MGRLLPTKPSFSSQPKTPVISRSRSPPVRGGYRPPSRSGRVSTPTPTAPKIQYVVGRKDVSKEQYESYVEDYKKRAKQGKLTEQELRVSSAYRGGQPSQTLEIIRQQEVKRIKAQAVVKMEAERKAISFTRPTTTPGLIQAKKLQQQLTQKLQNQVSTTSTLTRVQQPTTRFGRAEKFISEKRAEQRGKVTPTAILVGIGYSGLSGIKGIKQIITKPKEMIIGAGRFVKEKGKRAIAGETIFPEAGRVLRKEPGFAIGYVAGEVGTAYAFGESLNIFGRGVRLTRARISPKYKPVVTTPKGKRVVDFLIDTKPTRIELIKGTKESKIPLKQQVGLAGKKVLAVSGAKDFFKPLRPKVIIKKPGEVGLKKAFFADPLGRLRTKRMGVKQRAGIIDILSGDVSLFRKKPQALVFPDVRIAVFPKSLKLVARKIKARIPLTSSEKLRLKTWQLKQTGEFKPVGFVSKEAEIVLAPGEIVRKKKLLARTIIEREAVPFYQAEIITASKRTQALLNKRKLRKISSKELKELSRRLKRETGISRPLKPTTPSIAPLILGTGISLIPKRRPITPFRRRPTTPSRIISPTQAISPISPISPTQRISQTSDISSFLIGSQPISPVSPIRTAPRPRITPRPSPRIIPKPIKAFKPFVFGKQLIKPLKKVEGWLPYGRSRGGIKKGRWLRLSSQPMTKINALSRGAFSIDQSTANTFRIRKIKRKVNPNKLTRINNPFYFSSTLHKYRGYRIRKGKRIPLKNIFIEKKGIFRIDSVGEKRGLRLAKFIKQHGFIKTIRRKRRKKNKLYFPN